MAPSSFAGNRTPLDVGHVRHGEHARSWRQGLLEHADELVDARRTYRCGDPRLTVNP